MCWFKNTYVGNEVSNLVALVSQYYIPNIKQLRFQTYFCGRIFSENEVNTLVALVAQILYSYYQPQRIFKTYVFWKNDLFEKKGSRTCLPSIGRHDSFC